MGAWGGWGEVCVKVSVKVYNAAYVYSPYNACTQHTVKEGAGKTHNNLDNNTVAANATTTVAAAAAAGTRAGPSPRKGLLLGMRLPGKLPTPPDDTTAKVHLDPTVACGGVCLFRLFFACVRLPVCVTHFLCATACVCDTLPVCDCLCVCDWTITVVCMCVSPCMQIPTGIASNTIARVPLANTQ